MKRNLLVAMFAASGMMLTTSCSQDEKFILSEEEVQVTFSLGLEHSMKTRAISDGTGINKLHYAIFNSEGGVVESSKNTETGFPFTTTTALVKGETYTAVFWAQNKACTAYSVSEDMKSITIDYSNALNNDEDRDAFFKTETFTVTENTNLNIVLKRALAQLNAGMLESDWEDAKKNNITIAKSEVVIQQAATTLNLMDGSVSNPADVTFASSDILEESLSIDVDCDGERETYKYLSMSYFLVMDGSDGASKAVANLKFNLYDEDGDVVTSLQKGLENAPVQRNYRTNILISGESVGVYNVDVNVTMDPLYDGEHTHTKNNVWEEYTGIYTEEALAGKTIEVPAGWHIRNGYIIQPMPEYWTADDAPLYTKPYTIDGKGNTVKFEPYGYKFITKNAFAAADGQLVTVKNIKFAGEHFGIFGGVYGGVKNRNNYKTLFENVEIVDNAIYCYNKDGGTPVSAFSNLGDATLNNCTITGTYWVGAKDENVNAQKAIDSYGGVYDIFTPNDGRLVINNSSIGGIFVHNHGQLTLSGNTKVDRLISSQLVNGVINVNADAEVTLIDVNQYSDKYPPKVNISAGATVGTLQLNSINTKKIVIDGAANITKIIHNGVEYTSIADFKNSLL